MNLSPYDIEAYLRGHGMELRRRGANKVEAKRCPFCNGGDHHDLWKFVVYTDGGNYKCMRGTCDATGTFWGLAEHFGDDPRQYYPARERRTTSITRREPIYTKPEVSPDAITPEARAYLHKRGFSDKTIEYCKLFCEDGNIAFPYFKGDELVMVKYRKPRKPAKGEGKAWQKGGGLRTLWGIEQCDLASAPAILIVFGEYDRMACVEADIVNSVSVPHGDNDLEWIDICWDALESCREIYLWPDNDESGRTATRKIIERLGKNRIRIVRTERKDANELLYYDGRDAVWEAMATAEWVETGDLIDFTELSSDEFSLDGYKTGFPFLDQRLGGMLKGRLTVHTGNTSAGKTTAITQSIIAAVAQGARVCVWPGEDTEGDFRYKTRVHIAGKDGTELRTSANGTEYPAVRPEWEERIDAWAAGKIFVVNRHVGVDEQVLLDNFTLAYERYGCDVFVVDNLMALVTAKDTTSVNYRQSQIVQKLAAFAKSTRGHVHLITHTSKANNEDRPPESVRDVSGAAEIVNLADSCVSWWRVPDDLRSAYEGRDAVLTILKNRALGQLGSTYLTFSFRSKSFSESKYNDYVVAAAI